MTWMPIEARVRNFLHEFDFRLAEWDGEELTCYIRSKPGQQEKQKGVSGEPFGRSEFIYGSPTYNAWLELEEYLEDEVGNNTLIVELE